MDLNKLEATKVLNEILSAWNEEVPIQGFSIDKKSEGYEVRITLPPYLAEEGSKIINPIIEKHGYECGESNGFLVIFDRNAAGSRF